MNDPELMELCEQVFNIHPDWNDTEDVFFNGGIYDRDDRFVRNWAGTSHVHEPINPVPKYTSDYLLEKLPSHIAIAVLKDVLYHNKNGKKWTTNRYSAHNLGSIMSGWTDTPLKALLKLVVALKEAGVEV